MVKSLLRRVGLFEPVNRLRNRVVGVVNGWEPGALVTADSYAEACRSAVGVLRSRGRTVQLYVEFGVNRGTSMAAAHGAFAAEGCRDVRLVGFDSFEGLPPGSEDEGWGEGWFAVDRETTTAHLVEQGVPGDRVDLVEGWFSETLTAATRQRLDLHDIDIAMVDCDTYSSTVEALAFLADSLADVAVVFLDDWQPGVERGIGQREAFGEFLDAHPEIHAEETHAYEFRGAANARAFVLTRDLSRDDAVV